MPVLNHLRSLYSFSPSDQITCCAHLQWLLRALVLSLLTPSGGTCGFQGQRSFSDMCPHTHSSSPQIRSTSHGALETHLAFVHLLV